MPGDFEDGLRDRLHRATAHVNRGEDAWEDMLGRARRQRRTQWLTAGAATLAVVFLATLVPSLVASQTIEFAPFSSPTSETPTPTPATAEAGIVPTPSEPAAEATPAPSGATEAPATAALPESFPQAAEACGGTAGIAVVLATADGDLQAMCGDGAVDPLAGASARARNPAVSPDGAAVVFERQGAEGATSQLVHVDLATGAVQVLTEGALPAFAPDGTLAWMQGDPGTVVLRTGRPFSEPAYERGIGAAVTSLSWDADSQHLYGTDTFADSGEATVTDTYTGDEGPPPVIPLADDSGSGSRHLAVAGTPTAGTVGLVRRVGLDEGIELIYQMDVLPDPADSVELSVTDLSSLLPADATEYEAPRLGFAGAAMVEEAGDGTLRWRASDADAPAWLLSHEQTLWLIGADGSATALQENVQAGAMNPALELGPSAAGPDGGVNEVEVYYGTEGGNDCSQVRAVTRIVEGEGVLRGAIEALLAGPTSEDTEQGLSSFFSQESAGMLLRVRIADGTAYIEFDPALPLTLPNASTSCGSMSLLAQLDATATQFPSVDDAIYSLDGDVEAFYSWLQLEPPG